MNCRVGKIHATVSLPYFSFVLPRQIDYNAKLRGVHERSCRSFNNATIIRPPRGAVFTRERIRMVPRRELILASVAKSHIVGHVAVVSPTQSFRMNIYADT